MNKAILLVLIVLIFNACSNVYPSEVLVPVKCQIPARERPSFDENKIVESFKELLIYTEALENDLSFCRGKTQSKS